MKQAGKVPAAKLILLGAMVASSFIFFGKQMENTQLMMLQENRPRQENVEAQRQKAGLKKETLEKARRYLISEGIEKKYVDSVLSDSRLEKQQGLAVSKKAGRKLSYEEYKKAFGLKLIVVHGMNFYQIHSKEIDSASAQAGVPKEMIISILGIESFYGKKTGKRPVVNAYLTYLEEKVREKFVLSELASLLRICKRLKADPFEIKGSDWGAISPAQFIPSSLERSSVAARCKTFEELFSIETSIWLVAEYLQKAGASSRHGFGIGSANYNAAFEYNHSDYYARLAMEISHSLRKGIQAEFAAKSGRKNGAGR